MQSNSEGEAVSASLKVRDETDDYTTKSFLFNLYINIGILSGSLIIFVFYRWFRGDLKTLGKLLNLIYINYQVTNFRVIQERGMYLRD